MMLLQAGYIDWLAHLRGWDLLIGGLVVLGVVFFWKVMPHIIQKESKEVIKETSKTEVDKIITEKTAYIDENNAMIKTLCNTVEKMQTALEEAQSEKKWHDVTTIERLDQLSQKIEKMAMLSSDAFKHSIVNTIYNDKAARAERMTCLNVYLKAGGNGNVLLYAIPNVILPDIPSWLYLTTNSAGELHGDAKKEYQETLRYIRQELNVLGGKK